MFKVGDKVYLKSGSPEMRVTDIITEDSEDSVQVHCRWQGENGSAYYHCFREIMLSQKLPDAWMCG